MPEPLRTFQQKGVFYTDEQTGFRDGEHSYDAALADSYNAWSGDQQEEDPAAGFRNRYPVDGEPYGQVEQMQTMGEIANTRDGKGEIDAAAQEAYPPLEDLA